MQRALRKLVEEKVLKMKATPDKGETAEYALVDEERLTDAEEAGPKPESEVAESGPKSDMAGGSNPDKGGSKSDMPGSKPDMGGSFSDMGGSNPDNNTILIDNLLKDDLLKDPGYVEPGVSNPPTNTPGTDKLKGVKDVHPFARIVASGTHTQNPMSSKGTGSSESLQLPKSLESRTPDIASQDLL